MKPPGARAIARNPYEAPASSDAPKSNDAIADVAIASAPSASHAKRLGGYVIDAVIALVIGSIVSRIYAATTGTPGFQSGGVSGMGRWLLALTLVACSSSSAAANTGPSDAGQSDGPHDNPVCTTGNVGGTPCLRTGDSCTAPPGGEAFDCTCQPDRIWYCTGGGF